MIGRVSSLGIPPQKWGGPKNIPLTFIRIQNTLVVKKNQVLESSPMAKI
jgi:hypothetical protein